MPDSKQPTCRDPIRGASPFSNNIQAYRTLSLCRPSMHQSDGGIANQLHERQPWEHPGRSAQISKRLSKNCANGIYRSWLTKYHATYRRSRPSLSNILPCWANFATTSRLLQHGRQQPKQNVGARIGPVTKQQCSIPVTLTGYSRAPCSLTFYHLSSLWSRKALCWTRF